MTRLACVLVLFMTLVIRPAAQEPAATAAAPADDWVPERVTNLTVLPKDMPPAQVMRIMRAWNEALRVDCLACHVGQKGQPLSTFDFAADDKTRKETARVMLKTVMMVNEQFKAVDADEPPRVMCSTCHKRSRHVDADLPPE
jgi:hypothetical protein